MIIFYGGNNFWLIINKVGGSFLWNVNVNYYDYNLSLINLFYNFLISYFYSEKLELVCLKNNKIFL